MSEKNQKKEPLVTIGMPVWNGEKYLERALECLLNQNFTEFVLIISDNASIDSTEKICREYVKRDARVKYFRHNSHQSAKANFDTVLQYAQTEFFMWASYDDKWDKKFLSGLVNLLISNKTAVLAYSQIQILSEDQQSFETHPHIRDYAHMSELDSKNRFKRLNTFLQLDDGKSNLTYGLMRTESIKHIGGLNTQWGRTHYGEDILMIFRLLNFGEFVSTNKILFCKQIHERKEDPALKSRITRFVSNLFGKLDCFLSYWPIVGIADISRKEKIILKFRIFPRIFKWILSLIMNASKTIVKIK